MYTHFEEDYPDFQKMTVYPKMKVGWINANPWMVFHQNMRLPRSLHKGDILEQFSEFTAFFVDDLRDFFKKNKFKKADWKSVKDAMLNDIDVVSVEFGEKFKNILEKHA